jgi:hypothetical protein
MAIRTCVITPHNGLDSTVNYVWHLLEGISPNACPFNIPSLASVVAVQTASPKLPIFGVFGVSPFAAQHRSSGKGRSWHLQITAGTAARRALTGADSRPPFEGPSRPPVTPQCPGSVRRTTRSRYPPKPLTRKSHVSRFRTNATPLSSTYRQPISRIRAVVIFIPNTERTRVYASKRTA